MFILIIIIISNLRLKNPFIPVIIKILFYKTFHKLFLIKKVDEKLNLFKIGAGNFFLIILS